MQQALRLWLPRIQRHSGTRTRHVFANSGHDLPAGTSAGAQSVAAAGCSAANPGCSRWRADSASRATFAARRYQPVENHLLRYGRTSASPSQCSAEDRHDPPRHSPKAGTSITATSQTVGQSVVVTAGLKFQASGIGYSASGYRSPISAGRYPMPEARKKKPAVSIPGTVPSVSWHKLDSFSISPRGGWHRWLDRHSSTVSGATDRW